MDACVFNGCGAFLVVMVATSLWLEESGSIYDRDEDFVFPKPTLIPTQPAVWWTPVVLSPGLKRLELKADYSVSSNAKNRNMLGITSMPASWIGVRRSSSSSLLVPGVHFSVVTEFLSYQCSYYKHSFNWSMHQSLHRIFNLKRNPDYYTWTPSRTKRRNQWQYWILAVVSRCCSWCTAWNRCGRNFSCFVARWPLVTDKHFLCPWSGYQSLYFLFGTSLSG
jgi:hypothetical protein